MVLVDTGAFEYGLVVEELHDTVEIVVKPLGRHLKGLHDYAGATILGDGRVAVILDVAGLAGARGPHGRHGGSRVRQTAEAERCRGRTARAAAVPQRARPRPARCPSNRSRASSACAPRRSSIWADAAPCSIAAPACRWSPCTTRPRWGNSAEEQQWVVIVFERLGRPLGLLAAEPLDMVEAALNIDTVTCGNPASRGSAVFKDRTILMLDIFELADTVRPEGRTPSDGGGAAPAMRTAKSHCAGGRRFGFLPRPDPASGRSASAAGCWRPKTARRPGKCWISTRAKWTWWPPISKCRAWTAWR